MKQTTTTGGASPLLSFRFWRDGATDESDDAILREQLAAMSSFATGWLEPLAVAIDVVCCDPARGYSSYGVPPPAVQGWFLRTTSAGIDMEDQRVGSRVEECERIDPNTMDRFIRQALDQRCEANAIPGIAYLSWEAFRVRLPDADVTEFIVEDVFQLALPIEERDDGKWVSGPRTEALTGKPFLLTLDEGELRFDVIWSHWLGGAARQQVDAAVARVLARGTGWSLVS